ncbi:MAG: dihydrofolate reductase family protein, partial [Candidatus Methanofastidiosa archaeon]|nr:dihydrofolate reductase family protein [Candidatus Methanofastidiosa archaeon]
GGRDIIQQFLEKGLVDEMIIGIMPMTLGKGIPLFSDCGERELELLGIDKYEKGMVQLHYKILG